MLEPSIHGFAGELNNGFMRVIQAGPAMNDATMRSRVGSIHAVILCWLPRYALPWCCAGIAPPRQLDTSEHVPAQCPAIVNGVLAPQDFHIHRNQSRDTGSTRAGSVSPDPYKARLA